MSISGFDLAQARYDGATPPDVRELTDDPGTACLGDYPPGRFSYAYHCQERTACSMCGGVLCVEHDDDVADCPDGPAHSECHAQGCSSASCAEDARDAALMARDDADHGR